MDNDQREGRRLVPAVYRAAEILSLLGREGSLNLTEIWTATGLPKSSIFNLLTALTNVGLLAKDEAGGRYALGLKILTLAGSMYNRIDIRKVALPGLQRLTVETLETTHLAVLERQSLDVIYIEKMDSPQAVKLASYVGQQVPSYCTGLGKVLLGSLPDAELRLGLGELLLSPLTPKTITDPEEIIAAVRQIRDIGYAVDDEEYQLGVRCLAAPIKDATGDIAAAVSVAGPADRMSLQRLHTLVPLMVEVVADLSRRMGFAGNS